MSQRKRFIRKIIYACAIAALLLPLSWLSQPATTESSGGMLAQMREKNRLSQASLGEIDPASETIKLATLGMRGVAANILWGKAHEYQKRKDSVALSATLEQIARLQPNFVSVWIYQGWNLSYNMSVEFDDYHDRYNWVIKGVNYLRQGTVYNEKEPRLTSEIGWTIGQKIGRADEHLQYRRLFREDDDFNGSRPRAQRDNWLVGREYLLEAQRWVDQEGIPVKGKSPLLFHAHPSMCLINHAEALEEEGTFGEVAKNAWRKAADSWTQFSNRDLPTQYNIFVRLADKEQFDEKSKRAQAELVKMTPPGLREQLTAEKRKTLTEAELDAYDTPADQRTSAQNNEIYAANDKMAISHLEIAEGITGENHAAALKLAEEAAQADFLAGTIHGERDIINYDYWVQRCQLEPRDETLEARKKIYDADQAFTSAQLVKSRDLYIEGLQKWRKVIDEYKILLDDPNLIEELAFAVGRYAAALHQLDERMPEPFFMQDVLDQNENFTGRPYPGAPVKPLPEHLKAHPEGDGHDHGPKPADGAKPDGNSSPPAASPGCEVTPAPAAEPETAPTEPQATPTQPEPAPEAKPAEPAATP